MELDVVVIFDAELFFGKRMSCGVTDEFFSAPIVVGRNLDCGVNGEATELCGVRDFFVRQGFSFEKRRLVCSPNPPTLKLSPRFLWVIEKVVTTKIAFHVFENLTSDLE